MNANSEHDDKTEGFIGRGSGLYSEHMCKDEDRHPFGHIMHGNDKDRKGKISRNIYHGLVVS